MQRNTQHICNLCVQMRSPPLDVIIIPADAETPRVPKCRCLHLLRDIWPREIAFGWEKFDATLKMLLSVPSLFFMEKGDVYSVLFFVLSFPSVPVMWDQPSDGCLKTAITTLKFLACVPWAQAHMHAERSTWACCTLVSHPSQGGRALLQTSGPIFSQENLKVSCGHLYKMQVWRSMTPSLVQWWWYEWSWYLVYCDNPDCHHAIKLLVGSHNKLGSCKRGESRKGVEELAAGGETGKHEKVTITRRAGGTGHHLELMVCL